MKNIFYIVLSTFLFQSNLINSQKLEIQYLANEGILIKSPNSQVLIDAIFDKEFDYLDELPSSELKKIENAETHYKSIDIILATHLHGDHFNAKLIGNHLTQNEEAQFLAPKETVANFKENFEGFHNISSRVRSETPNFFESNTLTLNNIEVKVLRLEHLGTSPWKEAENVAYLITLEGKKILHLGDSKIDVKNLERFDLNRENIDVAVLPFWQLGSTHQRDIIKNYINPKLILAAHIPIKSYETAQKNIDSLGYENVIALTEQFKTILIE